MMMRPNSTLLLLALALLLVAGCASPTVNIVRTPGGWEPAEGYVWEHPGNYFDVRVSHADGIARRPPPTPSPFLAEHSGTLTDPEIELVNAADEPATVRLKGPVSMEFALGPYAIQSATIPAGTYACEGSGLGMVPLSATCLFEPSHRYSWTLGIPRSDRTAPPPPPDPPVVSGPRTSPDWWRRRSGP